MITVSKLVGKNDCAEVLHDLKIWNMDAEEVTKAHVQGFFYRAKLRTDRDIARNCANFIVQAITEAHDDRIVRNDRLNDLVISEPPYLSSDLRLALEQMTVPARRCVYFALLMGWRIEEAAQLTWSTVKQLRSQGAIHDAAIDVLDALPRHFKSDLVFWEQTNQPKPTMLVGLKLDVELAFNCTYGELLEKFQTMVLVDPVLHASELKTIWSDIYG